MTIPDRFYKIAKSYLDSARSRWEEIDTAAQKELDDHVASPALSAFERAQAKIRATQSDNQSTRELNANTQQENFSSTPTPTSYPYTDEDRLTAVQAPHALQQASQAALNGAYKVLGVPEGSELPVVQKAYQELQQRADPARFAAGSQDQKTAQDIQRRVNAAYILLANVLSPASDDRFDRLEI